MTSAKRLFLMRKLREKYSVKGRVASRYIAAGFSVTINPPLTGVDFTATKHGFRYAGIILWEKKTYNTDVVEKAHSIGEKYRVKPLIILYGSGPRITREAVEKARELGVIIRRIRG